MFLPYFLYDEIARMRLRKWIATRVMHFSPSCISPGMIFRAGVLKLLGFVFWMKKNLTFLLQRDCAHVDVLSKRLIDGINANVEHVVRNGDVSGYPGCVNLSFSYVEGESLLMALKVCLQASWIVTV